MKVMFIVQGEGRGHLTQAITLEEALRREGHEVVEVLVGRSKHRRLPSFFRKAIKVPVRQFESPNFLPSPANKRNDLPRSVAYNVLRLHRYASSIWLIHKRIKASGADIVVNFYELLTGLTYLLLQPDVPQVSIGHQYLFLHSDFHFPKTSRLELLSLRLFTHMTCLGARECLALSFHQMKDDPGNKVHVVPPLLRSDILSRKGHRGNYLHGYMVNSGFGESVMRWHSTHPTLPLNFFWDKKDAEATVKVDETLTFHQLDDKLFIDSMQDCMAYATTAGFESVCEAMYLGKPIMMVPAHIEQDCNAYDASLCGAGIVSRDFDIDSLLKFAADYRPDPTFRSWAASGGASIAATLERVASAYNASKAVGLRAS